MWIHDWLCSHCNYDTRSSTNYHGPETMVTSPYKGVCDSYSKAYKLMAEAAGLQCERVTSYTICHAWNEVLLDGQWYELDATWDDTKYTSRGYCHLYCLVNDTLMSADHSGQTLYYPCTAMADNYYLREGYADTWLSLRQSGINKLFSVASDSASFTVKLLTKDGPWDISLANRTDIITACLAQLLNDTDFTLNPSAILRLSVSASGNKLSFSWTLRNDLELPAGLTVIPAETFRNCGTALITVPDGVTAIGAYAFADNESLLGVYLPASVTAIDETAFSGSDNAVIYCPASAAAVIAFGEAQGITVEIQ